MAIRDHIMTIEDLVAGDLYKLLSVHQYETWSYHWDVSELEAGTSSANAMKDVNTEHPIVYLETKYFGMVGVLHTFLACSRFGNVPLIIGLKDNHVNEEVIKL